jgi:hypothetical protein
MHSSNTFIALTHRTLSSHLLITHTHRTHSSYSLITFTHFHAPIALTHRIHSTHSLIALAYQARALQTMSVNWSNSGNPGSASCRSGARTVKTRVNLLPYSQALVHINSSHRIHSSHTRIALTHRLTQHTHLIRLAHRANSSHSRIALTHRSHSSYSSVHLISASPHYIARHCMASCVGTLVLFVGFRVDGSSGNTCALSS